MKKLSWDWRPRAFKRTVTDGGYRAAIHGTGDREVTTRAVCAVMEIVPSFVMEVNCARAPVLPGAASLKKGPYIFDNVNRLKAGVFHPRLPCSFFNAESLR
jgi:hypothetical protein